MSRAKFRPLKAPNDTPESPEDIARLIWPMYYSDKIDGIRLTNYDGCTSAQNKPFPSRYVHDVFGVPALNGVDGEAGYGAPNSPTIFSDTYSALMTHGCVTPVNWYVFDICGPVHGHRPYRDRIKALRDVVASYAANTTNPGNIIVVEQKLVHSWEEALEQEAISLSLRYEGGMLRSPIQPYKYGRSTLIQNYLIKLKRFETREAVIIGFFEKEHNDNEATLDERGYTKRSSHKENKRAAGTLGGFIVRDLETGVEFRLGSGIGLDDDLRQKVWNNQEDYMGLIVSYKKLKLGEKDKPRNCTFRGFRDPIDL